MKVSEKAGLPEHAAGPGTFLFPHPKVCKLSHLAFSLFSLFKKQNKNQPKSLHKFYFPSSCSCSLCFPFPTSPGTSTSTSSNPLNQWRYSFSQLVPTSLLTHLRVHRSRGLQSTGWHAKGRFVQKRTLRKPSTFMLIIFLKLILLRAHRHW